MLKRLARKVTDNLYLKRNPYLERPAWDYQKEHVSHLIGADDVVLDIGSGNYPVPRANLLADFFPDNNFHRSGNVVTDRPLIACSIERLPFLGKSIDFVICSHVFEHVDSPIRGGLELGRIAKRGFIETPAYGKDILVGSGYMHKWQVVEFEGVMHFFEYSRRQAEAHVTSPVMELWLRKGHHAWQDFFWERQDLFNAMHVWTEKPHIVEHRRNGSKSRDLPSWRSVDGSSLPQKPCVLTEAEITLIERCLATPDGRDPMKFSQGCFVNAERDIRYPVYGKTIVCEVGRDG
jgi:hypothetical protein